jgi:CRP-like cAMP-binding protein
MTTQSLPITAPRDGNQLLAALSPEAYARLSANFESIPLELKSILWEPDQDIAYAYFPQSGCLSLVTVMEEGGYVEVGTIGFEGMSPVSFLNGVTSMPTRCIVQVPGRANRIERSALVAELRESESLSHILHRYAEVWVNQVSRAASCNAVHTVEERCARWLLMTHDRVQCDVIPLTQEFLAIMLGVRRASVTVAAGTLHKAGLIHYSRGRITIHDRVGLEAASCDCYHAMETSYARLLFPWRRGTATDA